MKKIPNFSNYMVSKFGEVYSIPKARTLKLQKDKDGYETVALYSDEGKRKTMKVHRLVALTYIPNTENKPYVNHKDGIKDNNHKSNLEWCTAKENVLHSYVKGLQIQASGEKRYNSVLTEWGVKFILLWKELGHSIAEVARAMGYGHSTISHVWHKRNWKHVTLREF